MVKNAKKKEKKVDYSTMDADRQWLMGQNLSEYAGQWIAVYRQSILARGVNLKRVMDKAEGKEIAAHPLYLRIPEGSITR